jgi:hypothetical protein
MALSKTKMNVNWHLHFLLQCHLKCPIYASYYVSISICKVSIDVCFYSSQLTLHVKNLSCACHLMRIVFLYEFLRVCRISKTCQNFCQKYTLTTGWTWTHFKTLVRWHRQGKRLFPQGICNPTSSTHTLQ